VRERHFETIIQNTLRHVIITNEYPRTQIQVILQITATPEMIYTYGKTPHAASGLEILPALLHAALLALLSTAIPMRTTYSACIVAESNEHRLVLNPSLDQLRTASSVHVIAMSKSGKCLVIESEGWFNMDILETAIEKANEARGGESERIDMDDTALEGLESLIQSTVTANVMAEERWRGQIK
jgi:exosome complex component RRP46